jgi:hypothetical protein
MAKERLSKLQKWILNRIYKNGAISKPGMKGYFNKEIRDALNNSERVTLHKSVRNLIQKELLTKGPYGSYILTEKGFNALLKANVSLVGSENVSFKDYQEREEKSRKEYESWLAGGRVVAGFMGRRGAGRSKRGVC